MVAVTPQEGRQIERRFLRQRGWCNTRLAQSVGKPPEQHLQPAWEPARQTQGRREHGKLLAGQGPEWIDGTTDCQGIGRIRGGTRLETPNGVRLIASSVSGIVARAGATIGKGSGGLASGRSGRCGAWASRSEEEAQDCRTGSLAAGTIADHGTDGRRILSGDSGGARPRVTAAKGKRNRSDSRDGEDGKACAAG